ncbi:hypothetical protein sS8_1119 [Methylocaldum marinum]|uniref:Uncharacterized protein n=1 Tax=Methylocaldum marinum TaxID=1432792 RepID=A0A250KQ27_9GAMM|nr:hypothetical protein [Methylocaldum marinum]BBA33081.1 hypothetical protein sS8_1119 [Methylocaldum marinum]
MNTNVSTSIMRNRTQLLLLVLIALVSTDLFLRLKTPPEVPKRETVGVTVPEGVDIRNTRKCNNPEECDNELRQQGFVTTDEKSVSVSVQTLQKDANSVYCVWRIDMGGQIYLVPKPPIYYPNTNVCPAGMIKVPG